MRVRPSLAAHDRAAARAAPSRRRARDLGRARDPGSLAAIFAPVASAAGEIPVRIPDQAVYDLADAFDQDAERTAESLAGTIRSVGDADVVVVVRGVDAASAADALVRATELRVGMDVGGDLAGGGLLAVLRRSSPSGCDGTVAIVGGRRS